MKSFSAQVDAWVKKSQLRTDAIFKESVQRTANLANTSRKEGGLLPHDTGFLQNSMSAQIGSLPRGPSAQGEPEGDPGQVALVLNGAKITDIVYVGWTAEYARINNMRFGFRDAAVQRWQQTVTEVTEEAKRRIP